MTHKVHFLALLLILISFAISSCAFESQSNDVVTAQEIIARDEDKEWDLVILGDSDMWLSYKYYVPMFEDDLGIEIVVHDKTRPGIRSPATSLRGNQDLMKLVSEAEIIVFNMPFVYPGTGGACFDQFLSIEDDGCFDVTQEEYASSTLEMITLVKELAGSDGAMIRLQNMFVPLDYWKNHNVLRPRLDNCLKCFKSYWDTQAEVAENESIPLVDVYSLFHGPNSDQDPYTMGFFGADPIHVNDEGAKAIAELYRSIGYEYWLPQ
jgi:hypothetical protein